MKKNIITFLFLFVVGFPMKAQQQELIENTWYLEKLRIDGLEIFPPNNEEVTPDQIRVRFTDQMVEASSGCNWLAGDGIYLEENNTFEIGPEGWAVSSLECQLDENSIFENHYFYEFWSINFTEIPDPFQYEIQSDGTNFSLVVTNSLGSEAHFNNFVLSATDLYTNLQNSINIFPNPVKEKLIIENSDLKITSINLIDATGKLIKSQVVSEKQIEIDFSIIPKGIYFIQFEQYEKIIKTEKVIKK